MPDLSRRSVVASDPFGPPPDLVTTPDQISDDARQTLIPLDGERILHVWRTREGFLVLTNLRAVLLWQRARLFGAPAGEWHEGATFYLFDLAPPRVVGPGVLELSETANPANGPHRFLVQDAGAVADAIMASIPAGREAWQGRRARVLDQLRALQGLNPPTTPASAPAREIVRVVVKVPCRYCGVLMDEAAPRCPNCGAAQH